MNSAKYLLDFFETIGKLKTTKRTGWVLAKIKNPESVAEHSFRMTIMAMFLAKKLKCSQNKLIKLCLLHDVAEAICGDLVLDYSEYFQEQKKRRIYKKIGITKKEKERMEKKSIKKLCKMPGQREGKELEGIWKEFAEGKTREARMARQLDKLEMLLQATEYKREKKFSNHLFNAYLKQNKDKIKEKELEKILEKIIERAKK